jgi:hypothetical protein
MATPVSSGSEDSTQTSPPVSHPTISPALPAIQNVHHHVSQKLSQDNYLLWQFLMVPFLEGQNFYGLIKFTFSYELKLLRQVVI